MKSWSSSFLHGSILFGIFSLAVVLRVSNFEFVLQDLTGHLNFIDPDNYYQLRRLVYFLANFPKILLFDPLIDWPRGSMVDWPEGFHMASGVILKIFGVNSFRELEWGACLLSVAYGLIFLAFLYTLARRVLADASLSALVTLFGACNFLIIRHSCFGVFDHHIFEAIFPLAFLLFGIKVFEEESPLAAFVLGLLLAFSLTVSSSSLFSLAAFFAAYGFLWGRRGDAKVYLLLNLGLLGSLFLYVLYSHSLWHRWVVLTHSSLFHWSLLVLLSIYAFLISRFRRAAVTFLIVGVALAGLCASFQWPDFLYGPLRYAFVYVFVREGTLQNVTEASPIFMHLDAINLNFIHINFGYVFYLLPIALFALCFFRRLSFEERGFFIFLVILAIPGIAQKRFAHILMGVYLIFVGWVLMRGLKWLKSQDIRLGPLIVLFTTVLMIVPLFQYEFSPRGAARDAVDLNLLKIFLKRRPVESELAWKRLALKEPVTEGIWANPNLGHQLTYMTGLGSATNSYYHGESMHWDFKLRTMKSMDEFLNQLRDHSIRYFFVADDFGYFELLNRMHGSPEMKFARTEVVNGHSSVVYDLATAQRFAWVRLLMNEDVPNGLDRFLQVRFSEPHLYTYIRAFELTAPPAKK